MINSKLIPLILACALGASLSWGACDSLCQASAIHAAEDLDTLGTHLQNAKKYAQAEVAFRKDVKVLEQAFGLTDYRVADGLMELGWLLSDWNKFQEMEPIIRRALTIREASLDSNDERIANSLYALGVVTCGLMRCDEGAKYYQRAIALRERINKPDASLLINLGAFYYDSSRYEEAEPLFRKAYAVVNSADKIDSTKLDHCIQNLSNLLDETGKSIEAEPLQRALITLREKKHGAVSVDVANANYNLANTLVKLQRFIEAESLFRKSLHIYEVAEGINHEDVADALNRVAFILSKTEHENEAEPLYKRALSIRQKKYGKQSLEVVDAMNALAQLYTDLNQLKEAELLYRQVLNIREKTQGSDNVDIVSAADNVGMILSVQGRYGDADPFKRRSLAIDEKSKGPESYEVAFDLYSIANGLLAQMKNAEAELIFRRALSIREKIADNRYPKSTDIMNDLALVLYMGGRYHDAESLYVQELAILEKDNGLVDPSLIPVLNNLGDVQKNTGRNGDSEVSFKRALAIAENATPIDSARLAGSLNNLALLYEESGRAQEAEPLLRRALLIQDKHGNSDPGTIARGKLHLGFLLNCLQKGKDAEPYLRQAIAIYDTLGTEGLSGYAEALRQLSSALFLSGRSIESIPSVFQAIQIAQQAKNPVVLWMTYRSLFLHLANSNTDLGILFGKQGVNITQGLLANLGNNKETAKSYVESLREFYTMLINYLIYRDRIPEAQQVMALLKEGEWKDFTQTSASVRQANVVMTPFETMWNDSLQHAGDRVQRFNSMYNLLRDSLKVKTPTSTELIKLETWKKSKQQADSAYSKLVEQMQQAFLTRSDSSRSKDVEQLKLPNVLPTMVASLPKGTVLLQYMFRDSVGYILETSGLKPRSYFIHKGTSQINPLVVEFLEALRNPALDPRPTGKKLYDILMAPIAKDLDSLQIKTIMFSLDGTLRYIPMAALWDGTAYLTERYATSQFTAYFNEGPKKPWTVAGFGNTLAAPGFVALPSVRAELQGIVRENKTDSGSLPGFIRLDSLFTKDSLQAALRKHPTVVHLASHFNFSPQGENDSYLLLGDGSKLTLHDLRTGKFAMTGVDLLTLSACQTALIGDRNANGVEIEGMAGVAQSRGASAVLATLWPVADASTQQWMQEFYRLHETGFSKAEAMRNAQLALLHSTVKSGQSMDVRGFKVASDTSRTPTADPTTFPNWSHPFYWAPFVLMGNWL